MIRLGTYEFTEETLKALPFGQTCPEHYLLVFERHAVEMETFPPFRRVQWNLDQRPVDRMGASYRGRHFEWRVIASHGGEGLYVPVKPVSSDGRVLFYNRDAVLQAFFPRLDLKAMIRARARFFELMNQLWDVTRWYGYGHTARNGISWMHWDGDEWLRHFANMDLSTWRKVRDAGSDIQEIADLCGSLPRLKSLQTLILAGMGDVKENKLEAFLAGR